jgi:hypothetical protein
MAARLGEADDFYNLVVPRTLSAEGRAVMRQALSGTLWSAGIGASQQTGWTGLVAKLLQQSGE